MLFKPITIAELKAHEVQPTENPVRQFDDKFILSNDQLILILITVISGLMAGLVFLFTTGLNDKKELTGIITDNKKSADDQIDALKERLQSKADDLVTTINSLNNSTIQIAQKMDLFIAKANELEKQLERHEQTLTKRVDFFERRVDILERQNAVLFTYIQRFIRVLAVNESVLTDLQSFLEGALIDAVEDGSSEAKKKVYKRSKPRIDADRIEDLKNLVSDYNASRLPLYQVTQLLPSEAEDY